MPTPSSSFLRFSPGALAFGQSSSTSSSSSATRQQQQQPSSEGKDVTRSSSGGGSWLQGVMSMAAPADSRGRAEADRSTAAGTSATTATASASASASCSPREREGEEPASSVPTPARKASTVRRAGGSAAGAAAAAGGGAASACAGGATGRPDDDRIGSEGVCSAAAAAAAGAAPSGLTNAVGPAPSVAATIAAVAGSVSPSAALSKEEIANLASLRSVADALFSGIEARLRAASQKEKDAEAACEAVRLQQAAMEQKHREAESALEAERAALQAQRREFEEERERMQSPSCRRSDVLSLNIGGERVVQRRRSTLCALPDSFLAARFSGRWEQEVDRDEEGRYFINYSPELFLPLLDFLGARETEDPARDIALPVGPDNQRPQFQAMLRHLGILPAVSFLDCVATPYSDLVNCDYGLAFELTPKGNALNLLAVEASAGCSVTAPVTAKIYICQGTLMRRLRQRDEWQVAAIGNLRPGIATRIELLEPIRLQANTQHCLYIATNNCCGIAFGGNSRGGEVSGQSEDLAIYSARSAGSALHFSGFEGFLYWHHFNGRLEYTLADGM